SDVPPVAAPVAAYAPAGRSGNKVLAAGQLPLGAGSRPATGKVGGDVSVDEAKGYARTAALNAIAAVHDFVGVDSIKRIVKVVGFVSSAAGFTAQPSVINGASELFGEVFGEAGQHARWAVGVAELPLGSPVEVELIVETE